MSSSKAVPVRLSAVAVLTGALFPLPTPAHDSLPLLSFDRCLTESLRRTNNGWKVRLTAFSLSSRR